MNQQTIATLLQSLPTTPQESFHTLLEGLFGFKNLALAQTSVLEDSSLFDPKEAIIYFTNADYEAHLRQATSTEHKNLAFSLIPITDTSRSALLTATKAINKAISSYNIIFFLSSTHLSIAFATRRYAKNTHEKKDVLEKIILIKGIDLASPHPAHIKNLLSIASIEHGALDEYYKAILEALSIEKLNAEFFQAITGHFLDFCQHISLPGQAGGADMGGDTLADTKREFVLRLLSRILFCKFLEKKGLVDSRLWDTSLSSEYYHEVCEPLFFTTLNTPRESRNYGILNDIAESKIVALLDSVPYLNGGLFAPQENGDYYKLDSTTGMSRYLNTLIIPNKCFEELFKTLDSYHFTLDESTPYTQEIGLDPELLGMVFENLLSVLFTDNKKDDKDLQKTMSKRKATGSYYTPREIVSYMCKSALAQSLHTKCEQKIEYEKLKTLVFDEVGGQEIATQEADTILRALHSLKILDPACGSGAFPMGMLQEILNLWEKLDEILGKSEPQSAYERKLRILQDNIYGVDIQPMATEIARLRCFLSLICDAPSEHIAPLPNLEFKFVSANSLIPLPKQKQLFYREYENDMKELERLRQETFSTHNKSELESRYLALCDKIAKNAMSAIITNGGNAESTLDENTKLDPRLEWNPFDPHSVAGFFDTQWMFGIKT